MQETTRAVRAQGVASQQEHTWAVTEHSVLTAMSSLTPTVLRGGTPRQLARLGITRLPCNAAS